MEGKVNMNQIKKGESVEIDDEKWVYDSSVDHKGRVPFRASTGVWKASLFIIGTEFNQLIIFIVPNQPIPNISIIRFDCSKW